MLKKVFTIHDAKVEAYLPPFYLPTVGAAKRAINDVMEDPQHNFSKHTADYTLFLIADFDDETALFSNTQPISICNLLELKKETVQL